MTTRCDNCEHREGGRCAHPKMAERSLPILCIVAEGEWQPKGCPLGRCVEFVDPCGIDGCPDCSELDESAESAAVISLANVAEADDRVVNAAVALVGEWRANDRNPTHPFAQELMAAVDARAEARGREAALGVAFASAAGGAAIVGFAIAPSSAQPASPGPPCYYASTIRVIDGDSIEADLDITFELVWRKQKIRVARIDTPERKQPGFDEATALTQSFVDRCEIGVQVCTSGRDKFGRLLGDVRCGVLDLAEEHLQAGTAKLYGGGKR